MHCLIYARVSTLEQAERELSIPAQLAAMHQYATQRNWTILEEFVEAGVSAKTVDRPQLRRLLARCRDTEHDPVEVVLVHKIDRLARNVADHAAIRVLLQERNIKLASVSENLEDTVSGQLVENIMAAIAEFYSANLADEVKKGMRQKVLRGGWPHKPPRGYVIRREGERHSVVEVHPKEGPLITRAFELYATGWYSLKRISQRLAQDGLMSRRGQPLATGYVHSLLCNPFYAGRVHWQDLDVPGQHQALVSLPLFERVQQVISNRYRDPGTKGSLPGFFLRGIAQCAACRARMTAERHDRWSYYRCCRQSYKTSSCSARYCNVDRAHADFERICKQIQLSRATAAALQESAKALIQRRAVSQHDRVSHLEVEQSELLAKEMRLTEVFVAGDVSPQVYRAKTADLRAKQTQIQLRIDAAGIDSDALLAKVITALQLATSIWDLYQPLDEVGRRDLIRSVFKSIVMAPEGIVGFTLKAPLDRLVTTSEVGAATSEELIQAILDAA